MTKKQPNEELQFVPADIIERITARANALLRAIQIEDNDTRNRVIKFIQSATILISKVVPYKRRPRSMSELLFIEQIKNAYANIRKGVGKSK